VSASWSLLESAERFPRFARYTPLMKSTIIHLLWVLLMSSLVSFFLLFSFATYHAIYHGFGLLSLVWNVIFCMYTYIHISPTRSSGPRM